MHSHRSSKKSQKPFKSKHASKGSIKALNKGKIEKTTAGNKAVKVMGRLDRRNQKDQIRAAKMVELATDRKLFDGKNGAPKIVTVVGMSEDVDVSALVCKMMGLESISSKISTHEVERFKQKFTIITPSLDNFLEVLDAARIADFVILAFSPVASFDDSEYILKCVAEQGVSNVASVVTETGILTDKKRAERVEEIKLFSDYFFPQDKIYDLDHATDCSNLVRNIAQKFPKGVNWRDQRAFVLADAVQEADGLVCVSGVVRGKGFNLLRNVHLPGYGDFAVSKAEVIKHGVAELVVAGEDVLAKNDAEDDDMDMEEDMEEDVETEEQLGVKVDGHHYFPDNARNAMQEKYAKRRVPKGTSEQQAKWLIDETLINSDDEFEDEQMEQDMEMDEEDDDENHVEFDVDEEKRQLEEYKSLREELDFPDEVELKPGESAKERFRKYRGMKSLRNWDPAQDEYPEEYKKCVSFNYNAMKNRVLKDSTDLQPGQYVKLYIVAPVSIVAEAAEHADSPFVVYGLHKYESDQAVCHVTMNPCFDQEDSAPIKSKDELILQLGARRLVVNPLYGTESTIAKFDRFLTRPCMATYIGPATFGNVPALWFRKSENGALELVGTGSFDSTDPRKMLIKRAVLTGHPFKIHKKLVTIRYMFFNPEDINWFKAVPLFTKMGRSGFIKMSLGTHGYMKATFDQHLNGMDTVAMALYKRVWPKVSREYE
ncbi:Ribosome biogenesis protein [Yarrowia sp. C11]|nr:Ribosome biogenesis protein [Yarrowia sp. E02]KAG5372985.1 Ribosome biogenesis protein [Yarrowia sp. C11]